MRAVALALVLAACATRPAPEPDTPDQATVAAPVIDEAPPASVTPAPRRVSCPAGGDTIGTLFLEHQVEMWARLQPPATPVVGDTAVVTFVVDTGGRPEMATLEIALPAGRQVGAPLRAAVGALRYLPALFDGCRVRQQVRHVVARKLVE